MMVVVIMRNAVLQSSLLYTALYWTGNTRSGLVMFTRKLQRKMYETDFAQQSVWLLLFYDDQLLNSRQVWTMMLR